MLACARIGAPHTVVFGGFSADALAGRIQDCDARVVITADGGYRRGAAVALKPAVDEAVEQCPDVAQRAGRRRTGQDESSGPTGRDVWWHDVVDSSQSTSTSRRRSTPSTRSTSCTRPARPAKPKGILHTTGGYLTGASYTHWAVFDLKPETDIYWCTADIGWVTGHSLHRLRPARQRRDVGDVRGHARHPAQGPLVGDRRRSTRRRSSTPRRRRSARS